MLFRAVFNVIGAKNVILCDLRDCLKMIGFESSYWQTKQI
jgi:hypothetical protein